MPDYSKYYEARTIISKILHDDLIGPVTSEEVIPELPTQYYIMGKLYPQSESGEVIDLVRNPFLENAVETYDASISLSNQKNPSSMGITCTLKAGINEILLTGSYAFYLPVLFEDAAKYGIDISKWQQSNKKPKELWQRKGYEFQTAVQLGTDKVEKPVSLDGKVQLQIYTHDILENGERVITVAMVNTNQAGEDAVEKAKLCVFQPVLKIESPTGDTIFTSADRQEQFSTDEELLELELLYYDINCYGQGHGCSVEWDIDNIEPLWVSSAWLPSHNLHQMMAAQIQDDQVLSMKYLSEAMPLAVISSLRSFIRSYQEWISRQAEMALNIDDKYRESADANIRKCTYAYERMSHSIDLLEQSISTNRDAIKAFQLANEAMLLQRRQTLQKEGKEFNPDEAAWLSLVHI